MRAELQRAIETLRGQGFSLPTQVEVALDKPKRPEHGDLASNVAMSLAKAAGRAPREIATAIVAALGPTMADANGAIASAEIAGPGFLNLRVRDAAVQAVVGEVLGRGREFGRTIQAAPRKMLLEFISANPTGPLHLAHARGAVVGDALVRLFRAVGHDVATEYYVNDAGQKVVNLALTVRCLLHDQPLWKEAYKGDYVLGLAKEMAARYPDLCAAPVTFHGDGDAREPDNLPSDRTLAQHCVAYLLEGIRKTIGRLAITIDSYFSEQSLIDDGRVPKLVADWVAAGKAEARDGAIFFKVTSASSEEDKDRVLRKSSGDYTYFASDAAYHRDKIERGHVHLVDVWGSDHHGYQPRMRAALEALGLPKDAFEVVFMQMVSLLKNGATYRMSKTEGTFITIDEILDDIDRAAGNDHAGADALRYFLLSRSSDSPMEIDVDLAKKQSMDNPVFYAQYTHARMCQILVRAKTAPEFESARASGRLAVPETFDPALASRLVLPEEKNMLALCDEFPSVVREAADGRAPHRVLFFAQELAQAFASYYTRLQKVYHDTILPQRSQREQEGWEARWDWDLTRARLMWVGAIRTVYAAALTLLGITAPERMTKLLTVADEETEDNG